MNCNEVKEHEAGNILDDVKEEIKDIPMCRKDACTPIPMECDHISGNGTEPLEDIQQYD